MKSTVIDVMLQHLRAEEVRHVFGVPGGLLHPFFDAIELSPDIELVVTKHEQGAVFMADGYARNNARLGVCAGTAGPGSTNMLTGVAVAFSSCVPVLVLTGQVPSSILGRGASQETGREDMDIVGMFAPVTKYSAMVTSPDRFAHHLRRALRLAMSGRWGPVHLNIPVNFWGDEILTDVIDPDRYRPPTRYFDREAVRHLADLLVTASYPVFLAGSGVATSRARKELRSVVERVGARVVTTPAAKGVFPEDHPLSSGVVGLAGHQAAKDLVLGDEVDVLVCIGTSLNERATFNWDDRVQPRKALVQIDIDPDRIGNTYPIDIALVGDARTILKEVQFHLTRALETQEMSSKWDITEPALGNEGGFLNADLRASDDTPLTPQRWRCDLLEVLPQTAIVYSDIGGHMLFNIHHLVIGREQEFNINLGFASMGHGTVAPIGAKFTNMERPVFAIVGDACFTMNGMELIVAVEQEIPVIWIVENNNMHGVTWHGSKKVSGGRPMRSIEYKYPLRVAEISAAMGLDTYIVDGPNQMQEVVRQALAANRPTVIEVQVDPSYPPPLQDRAEVIGGFGRE